MKSWNHTWKCQVTSLIRSTSQLHSAPWSIKHGNSEDCIRPFLPSHTCPMAIHTAGSLVQWTHRHTHIHTQTENVTRTSIQRIIGKRCRCAGCSSPRPEKRMWCVSNGKWRWVILALLAVMIFLLGKAAQPGEGDGKNVNMQANARMAFVVSCRASAWVMWFRIYSRCQDTNFTMLISARRLLAHLYPRFPVIRLLIFIHRKASHERAQARGHNQVCVSSLKVVGTQF